jgi:NAD(P)H-flavin reductase
MVSVLGAGEIPISITSTPGASKDLEICVRTAGHVSAALNRLNTGDRIWVRGPYGRPFPVNGHQDTLFICGGIGIVPLRPLINQMINKKAAAGGKGAVTVMYGSRNPSEALFMDEVNSWMERGANIVLTVDTCDIESWKGCTGLVTEHFGKANVDFKNSTAYICGPHVMIQVAMRDLSLMGMPDDHIITTLEAHMKCGVGKCGHCYCGGKLICEEGPIFTFEEIKKYNIKPGRDSLG